MKSKTKQKKYFGLPLYPGWINKKGTPTITRGLEALQIPKVHSAVMAWFAERLILAGIVIGATAFAAGILFNIYLSPPIAASDTYLVLASKAKVAKQQIIDMASPLFARLLRDNHGVIDTEAASLDTRKEQIRNYLVTKHSPMAHDDQAIAALAGSKNMKLIVAISFVESNFGKHCYYYNCSGIGGTPPKLRKYDSYADWIRDFDDLLESRYKGLAPEKFIGLYVQPGSPNWIYGVNQVLNEFNALGIG